MPVGDRSLQITGSQRVANENRRYIAGVPKLVVEISRGPCVRDEHDQIGRNMALLLRAGIGRCDQASVTLYIDHPMPNEQAEMRAARYGQFGWRNLRQPIKSLQRRDVTPCGLDIG